MKKQLYKLLILAFPIIATQFSQMAMGVVDTIMSGHSSTTDLAAVAIGSSIWIPLVYFIAGVLTAITPTVAHYWGAKEYQKIGYTIRQSLWIALLLNIIGIIILLSIDRLFVFMAVEASVMPIAIRYLIAIAWGIPAIIGFFVLRCLNEGMSNIVPIMLTGILGLLVNIFCNYVLIFGHFGAPALGGEGAGWATSITQWFMLCGLFIYTIKNKKFNHIDLLSRNISPDFNELWKLTKLGVPIGITFFVEGSIFSVIALFIASMGIVTIAANQIALNFSSLVFILPLSLSISLTIQVGQYIGAGQFQQARDTIKVAYLVSLTISSLSALIIINFSADIASFYTDSSDVIALAASLMLFTALYQFSDGIQLCSAGSLRGLKDTTIPMILSIISYWIIGFPLGYTLALTELITQPMGAKGFWIGLLAGLTFSAILMTLRLYSRLKIR
ncbi:MAG: MATE family efflux transporter [gamma proteobacterium symbiont of Taylorina sp.]|nr:MATE family efflux transporter [gamma proteobacterium symbiont of Taylorina sp.]